MGDPLFHATSSAEKFGGVPEDYLALHTFLDDSKLFVGDWRHRALLHNTFGVWLCEKHVFGLTITRASDGVQVCTRTVATQHIIEDIGFLPTPAQFLKEMPVAMWMNGVTREQLQRMQGGKDPMNPNAVRVEMVFFKFEEIKPKREGYFFVTLQLTGDMVEAEWFINDLYPNGAWCAGPDDSILPHDRVGYWAERPTPLKIVKGPTA